MKVSFVYKSAAAATIAVVGGVAQPVDEAIARRNLIGDALNIGGNVIDGAIKVGGTVIDTAVEGTMGVIGNVIDWGAETAAETGTSVGDLVTFFVGGANLLRENPPLSSIKSADVAKHMVWTNAEGVNPRTDSYDSSRMPAQFAGVWWMDGNPLSDYLMSFGRSNWESTTVDGKGYQCQSKRLNSHETEPVVGKLGMPCAGGFSTNVYDKDVWTYYDSDKGQKAFTLSWNSQLNYKFDCGGRTDAHLGGKLEYCQVYMARRTLNGAFTTVVPKGFAHFDMTATPDEDLWIRNSYMPHKTTRYYLKRIIDGNGEETEYFKEYMSKGTAVPDRINDVFGNGADTREHVGFVNDTQLIRAAW